MDKLWKWVVGFLAEHVVLQLIASPALAYIFGWTLAILQGADAAFDAFPPLFWLILSTIVLAMTAYPGFVLPCGKWYRTKRHAYRKEVERVYVAVSGVYKPSILNPNNPGNPHAMKEFAQRDVDLLRPKLKMRRNDVPPTINVENENSLREWYEFLRDERVRANQ